MVRQPERVVAGAFRGARVARRSCPIAAPTRPRPSSRTAGARGRSAWRGAYLPLASAFLSKCQLSWAMTASSDTCSAGGYVPTCARMRAERVGRARRACPRRARGRVRRVVARCAHRPRPPPLGVHARGPGCRDADARGAGTRRRGRRARRSRREHDGVHPDSARSMWCRSSHSTGSTRRAAIALARDVRGVGRRRRSRCPCSSTATPIPSAARCPTLAATRSHGASPTWARHAAPHARRDRGRRAPGAGRGELRARPRRRRARARRSRARCASATADCPACARSGSCSRPAGRAQVSMNLIALDRDRAPGRRARRCAISPDAAAVDVAASSSSGSCRRPSSRVATASSSSGRHQRRSDDRGPASVRPVMPRARAPELRRRRRPALERTLAADPAALPLGEPAPDAELLAVGERVLEAVDPDLAPPADGLGLPGGRSPLGEEEVGIDPEAVGVLLPAALVPSRWLGGRRPGRRDSTPTGLMSDTGWDTALLLRVGAVRGPPRTRE